MSVSVKINYYGTARPPIVVDPPSANVPTGTGQVTWDVSGLPSGYTYEVEFSGTGSDKGCFPSLNTPPNPSRGVYVGADGTSLTAATDKLAATTWQYNVSIKQGGTVVAQQGAAIVISDN